MVEEVEVEKEEGSEEEEEMEEVGVEEEEGTKENVFIYRKYLQYMQAQNNNVSLILKRCRWILREE